MHLGCSSLFWDHCGLITMLSGPNAHPMPESCLWNFCLLEPGGFAQGCDVFLPCLFSVTLNPGGRSSRTVTHATWRWICIPSVHLLFCPNCPAVSWNMMSKTHSLAPGSAMPCKQGPVIAHCRQGHGLVHPGVQQCHLGALGSCESVELWRATVSHAASQPCPHN